MVHNSYLFSLMFIHARFVQLISNFAGKYYDKNLKGTMAGKLMYVPYDNIKITPFNAQPNQIG